MTTSGLIKILDSLINRGYGDAFIIENSEYESVAERVEVGNIVFVYNKHFKRQEKRFQFDKYPYNQSEYKYCCKGILIF